MGSRGAPRLCQRPQQRLYPLRGGHAAPGREPGGSLGGALTLTRLGPRRGRGVAAFVPGDLLPLRQKLRVRTNSRDVQAWGRRGVAMGLRPLPFLATYTKGRRGNAQSLPVAGGARPRRRLGLGSHPGGPASSRERRFEQGRGVGVRGKGETRRRTLGKARGPQLPGLSGLLLLPRAQEKGKGNDSRAEDWLQGRCVFGFPHVLLPPSPLSECLSPPPVPASKAGTESGSGLRVAPSPSRPGLGRNQGAQRLSRSLSAGPSASPWGRAGQKAGMRWTSASGGGEERGPLDGPPASLH